jgi:hypothetical protein
MNQKARRTAARNAAKPPNRPPTPGSSPLFPREFRLLRDENDKPAATRGTPPNLADEEGWVHDEALGVERRMVGDGTLQINSLNDAGSKQIVEALKALYGRRWGETERLEDCGDGRLVWVIEDEDKSAFEQALARPAGQTATTAAHRNGEENK